MEDSGEQHIQRRTLLAVQLAAISGFLEDNRGLEESCLAICNSCREFVPWQNLKVTDQVPPTLLAMLLPVVLRAEGTDTSRVSLPRLVLRLNWRFDDPEIEYIYKGGWDIQERWKVEEEYEIECRVGRGTLTFRGIDLEKVRWPEGLEEIYLGGLNRFVDRVNWPDSLEVLGFQPPIRVIRGIHHDVGVGGGFNRPFDGVTFPAALRELFLGYEFNQCIDGVTWPEGLERLSMPGFNRPIHAVQWPPGLTTLEFSGPYEFERRQSQEHVPWYVADGGFDQPLGTFLPKSLETLWLSDNYYRPFRGVRWPRRLAVLGLGMGVTTKSIKRVKWPSSLRKVVFCDGMLVIEDKDVPSGCELRLVQDNW